MGKEIASAQLIDTSCGLLAAGLNRLTVSRLSEKTFARSLDNFEYRGF
jgi:hypothetical protein